MFFQKPISIFKSCLHESPVGLNYSNICSIDSVSILAAVAKTHAASETNIVTN